MFSSFLACVSLVIRSPPPHLRRRKLRRHLQRIFEWGLSSNGAVTKYLPSTQGKHEDFLSVCVCLCMWTLIKLLSFNHSLSLSDLYLPDVFKSQMCDLSESCEVQEAMLTHCTEEESHRCQTRVGRCECKDDQKHLSHRVHFDIDVTHLKINTGLQRLHFIIKDIIKRTLTGK